MKRIALLLCLLLPAFAGRAADDLTVFGHAETNHVPRAAGPDDRTIAMRVAQVLESTHYIQHPLDAEFSGKFLDRYLDALDPQHLLFLQSDIEEFEKYRKTLGDQTKRMGDTMPGEVIFARFMDRLTQQTIQVTNLLASEKFTFDTDDRFTFNRKDAPRPKTLAEAQSLWRERLRWEYLTEKLSTTKPTTNTVAKPGIGEKIKPATAEKKPEEIQKIIVRRYARQLRLLSGLDSDEVLEIYLTALAHVYDPHSDYMGKPSYESFNISMKLALFGIGAVLMMEDGYCTIKSLSPGSPAERSGRIKVNDKVVMVAQGTNEPVDVVDMKLTKVVEQIRGAKGTEVRLTMIPADAPDARKVVSLLRDEIKLEDQEAKAKIFEQTRANGQEPLRVGFIDLPSFYADMGNHAVGHKSTTTDVAKLLKKLNEEHVAGVILDLRRNGGGSLEEAINLTGLFIKEGPVVQVKDPEGKIRVDADTDPSVAYDGPLVVMTSRSSASASEIFAGAMQDYGRALLVGDTSTHGKGTVQTVLELNRLPFFGRMSRTTNQLGALKFTINKFYRASGSSTQLKGVIPDIILPSIANYMEGGKSSLPGALPWDEINAAKYEPVNLIQPVLPELKKRSEARVATDRDFAWLFEEIERYKKIKNDKTVSLNEAQRIKEKQENEARADARKKELKARPQPTYKVYEITLKLADKPGLPAPVTQTNQVTAAKGDKPADHPVTDEMAEEGDANETVPAVDIHLDECRRILQDLIELANKTKAVAGKQ